MTTNQDFVVLSDDYDGLPTSCIHLFRRLARHNRVWWFNTVSRLPRPTLRDAGRVWTTLRNWTRPKPAPPDEPRPHVGSPIMLPWFNAPGRRFNLASWTRAYDKLRATHGIERPIVLTTFPFAVDFVRSIDAKVRVYYCVDDFLDYRGVDHKRWSVMEAELLDAVDGLVVTSRELQRTRVTPAPVLHLPHGVDVEHYHAALASPRVIPELEAIQKPIVGFFGLMGEWFDRSLLLHLADSFPQASFVLLGKAHFDLGGLARPTVHCLGHVPYAELPHYARYFDVGLIPYVQNQWTRSLNPLKLMEYYALGLPVLATRLPELEHVAGPLRLASSQDEFRAALGELLAEPRERFADDAVAVARANTWSQRVESLSSFLSSLGQPAGPARQPRRAIA